MKDDRLYRALDELLPHKDGFFRHFQQVYGELFGTVFDILLYDITSTYFEGQAQGNAQAHILVCFLAQVLWRTLQQWMDGCGLGTALRKLLEHMAEVRSIDVILPTDAGANILLRTVDRSDKHLAILLDKLKLPVPSKPKPI